MEKSSSNELKKDFRADLAALIQENSAKKHPDVKLLESMNEKILKAAKELSVIRGQYLRLHSIEDSHINVPYEIENTQIRITSAIHECRKVVSCLERELRQAKL